MRRLFVLFATLLAAIGTTLVAATPASASPTCNSYGNAYNQAGWWANVPVYWPGSGPSSLHCNMVRGNVSDAVKELQQALNDCYRAGLRVDGSFGRLTFEALKNAQGLAGARVDGVYGPETRDKIKWSAAGRPDSCAPLF